MPEVSFGVEHEIRRLVFPRSISDLRVLSDYFRLIALVAVVVAVAAVAAVVVVVVVVDQLLVAAVVRLLFSP